MNELPPLPSPPVHDLDLSTRNLVQHLRFLVDVSELSLDLIPSRPSTRGVVSVLRAYVQQIRADLAAATRGLAGDLQ